MFKSLLNGVKQIIKGPIPWLQKKENITEKIIEKPIVPITSQETPNIPKESILNIKPNPGIYGTVKSDLGIVNINSKIKNSLTLNELELKLWSKFCKFKGNGQKNHPIIIQNYCLTNQGENANA